MEFSDYEIAKAGGRNSGLYERFRGARIPEIAKSIRSLEKRIAQHETKIRDPNRYLRPDCTADHRADLIDRYWPLEIADFKQQINVLQGILRERSDGHS